ncbi:MAG: HD domain-containing protein, partial [Bacteroidetes bacterium]|nr:HD domain-containing protein [Bacteroidota bacterium]
VFLLLIFSITLLIVSELFFTLYVGVFDIFNKLGHLLKFVTFYLFYRAIIEKGLMYPYNLLFSDLKKKEKGLQEAHNKLETWANERTAKLTKTLQQLESEITNHKNTQKSLTVQLDRLAALRSIDIAIAGSSDTHLTFNIILEQVKSSLGIDAAAIHLLIPHTQIFEFAAKSGFQTDLVEHMQLAIGEGYAGLATLENRIIHVPDLNETDAFIRKDLAEKENFLTYFGVPLFAMGEAIGLLEVFHRTRLNPDKDWLSYLETLAGQVAIAVHSATLYKDLKNSNSKLIRAYDATLKGWAFALDLRDNGTEEHTKRVTAMTDRFAKKIGIIDEELTHVHRGALLHDIGKISVPDSVLLKPGPLTNDEWAIMQQHPVSAYNMLFPIAYLRSALDIPYCHHEKWDGTGYPRGIKREQIPLAARIFAVVDVWDALTSDRPYRKAWSEEKSMGYIQESSGSHFDPTLVDIFLQEVLPSCMQERKKKMGL